MKKSIKDEYDITAAFKKIENKLISSMMRNLKRHKVEEIKEEKQWEMWQALQLKSLAQYRKKNKKKFSGIFSTINEAIGNVIRKAKALGGMEQETAILDAIKKGENLKKDTQEKGAAAEFFKVNERKLDSLIKATTKDMERAEVAVLRRANDQYRKIIFNAHVYANTGAGTYEKAVDMATKDFLAKGIDCIEYKNGARHTISDYSRMAIRTASKRAYLQGEGEKRKEWGHSLVIVNKRGNPCPKCLPFCGKIFIDDVWSGGKKEDGDYPLLSSAVSAGLYHPNCKDSHTTYFPDISTPPNDKYTKKEVNEVAEGYKREQKEQYAAQQVKKYERLSKYSLDKENRNKYQQKAAQWETVAKSYKSDIIELSEEEMGAILRYKSSDSYGLNDALRRTENVEELTPKQRQFVKVLDSALSKMNTYEGNLVRTVDFSSWPDRTKRTNEFLDVFTIGKVINISQYWSTSKKVGYNDKSGIVIYIEGARKGRDISTVGLDENEVLYERNSKFEVISKMFHGGIWHILLREV